MEVIHTIANSVFEKCYPDNKYLNREIVVRDIIDILKTGLKDIPSNDVLMKYDDDLTDLSSDISLKLLEDVLMVVPTKLKEHIDYVYLDDCIEFYEFIQEQITDNIDELHKLNL